MKILHVHPTLGIGGVETYLYRLCGGLREAGHQSDVVSAGGLLEERVTGAGARLFKISPRLSHLDQLMEQIQDEKYDVIHAHNYRAAPFARRLSQKIGAKYVLSVHGPRAWWQIAMFRNWSEIVVAMSEGDRDNITGLGGIGASRVRLSFYGIDTTRFRPGLDTQAQQSEVGLLPQQQAVVHVSRFSNRKAQVGLALLEAWPSVQKQFPAARLFFVGQGPEKATLEAKIDALNQKIGASAAQMLGPRDDVEKWMNLATVVVATANTALESMACATATVSAGRTGYFGRVTPQNFESGRALCFADHGRAQPLSAERLGNDLISSLRESASEPQNPSVTEIAEMIRGQYTIEAMTRQIIEVYSQTKSV